jgi:O-antigen ligase
LAMLFFHRGRAASRLIIISLVVMATVFGTLSWVAQSESTTVLFRSFAENEKSVDDRINVNSAAIQMFMESPVSVLSGIGVGTFFVRSKELLGIALIIHNTFLWLLVEVGVLGFAVFLSVMASAFRNALLVAKANVLESPIAVGVFCALCATAGWFLGTEGLWHRHVWFLFVLSEVCFRVVRAQEATLWESEDIGAGQISVASGA